MVQPLGLERNAVVPDVEAHGVAAHDVAAHDVEAQAAVHNTVAAVQVASADSLAEQAVALLAARAAIGAEYELALAALEPP